MATKVKECLKVGDSVRILKRDPELRQLGITNGTLVSFGLNGFCAVDLGRGIPFYTHDCDRNVLKGTGRWYQINELVKVDLNWDE